MQTFTFNNLTEEEARAIVGVLGQLPTAANAHDLYTKLIKQLKDQLPQEEAPVITE
jgi:hypothetical protein